MRRVAAVVALGAVTIGAVGCGASAGSAGQNEVQASGGAGGSAPASVTAPPGTTRTTGTGRTGGTTPRGTSPSSSSVSIPDIPSIPNLPSIPDLPSIPGGAGNLQQCLDLANAYSQIFLPLSGGGSPSDADIAKATAAIDAIKSKVPSNIQADLDTLENGLKSAQGPGGIAQFLASPEFDRANQEITTYLTSQCTGGNT